MKRSLIGIAVAITGLVAVITGAVRADPLPGEVLKFYQTPLNNGLVLLPPGGVLPPGSVPAPWPGHDEISTAYLTNGNQYIGQYMADDFCDLRSTPIVHVMWWGSYMSNLVVGGVTTFLIMFETDVSATATNNTLGYSHPGTNIVTQIVTLGALAPGSGTYTETAVPIGGGPPNPDGNLFQYNAELRIPVAESSNVVEWIKIVALTANRQIVWGWHNRDYGVMDPLACTPPAVVPGEFNANPPGPPIWHFQDDAVTGPVGITLGPNGTNVFQTSWVPTSYFPPYDGISFSKDLAFALYTAQSQPPPAITIDEDGKGSTNGLPITGVLTNDPGPGGQSQALTYPLPFAGQTGDVILTESPAGGPPSDILRFNGNSTVVFYSDPFGVDTNDCPDSLADGPAPTLLYSAPVLITEVGPEGGTNGATYTPTSVQPGWDPSGPTYTFISDYPPLSPDPFTAWQLKYFGCSICSTAAPGADPDGDGMINTNEFLAGTDPTNSLSNFHITSIVRQGSGSNDINITWAARPCKDYIVQVSSGTTNDGSYVTNTFADIPGSLTIGGVVGGGFVRGDVMTNYVDVGGGTNKPSRYYRVRLVP